MWNTDNGCKLFRRSDGKFLGNIGNQGRGPFEYIELSDVIIDESKGVFLLPWNSKSILQFDLEGKPVRDIPLAFEVNKGIFDLNDSIFTIMIAPFRDMTETFLWQQDFEGNLIHSIDAEPFYVHPDYGTEFEYWNDRTSLNFFIFTFSHDRDSIFHYDKKSGKIYPEFTVDYKDPAFERHRTYYSIPGYYFGYFSDREKTDRGTIYTRRDHFYVEKESLKGGYYKIVNNFFAKLPIEEMTIRNGYYIGNYYPELLRYEINKSLRTNEFTPEDADKLKEYASTLRDDDNNILIIGKLKKL